MCASQQKEIFHHEKRATKIQTSRSQGQKGSGGGKKGREFGWGGEKIVMKHCQQKTGGAEVKWGKDLLLLSGGVLRAILEYGQESWEGRGKIGQN